MCDINCIFLFNLLGAIVLIILQQQQHVVASKTEQQQHHYQQQQWHQQQYISPYTSLSSYAAASAANYLRLHSLPHNVVKREIKNGKSTDFISYMNDFNMQDETSIPEDIIDQQHLQDIIDKQQQDIKEQQHPQPPNHAGESRADSSGLNGDDVIVDVNLPYDDSADTDSDADIILESQSSSERRDDNKSGNNSSSISDKEVSENDGLLSAEKNDMDEASTNFKETNNKKKMFKERISLKNKNDSNNKDNKQQQIKYGINFDYSDHINPYSDVDEEDEDEDKLELDEDDDDDDGSAEYERFKSMHEQKQREQQQNQKEEAINQKPIISKKMFCKHFPANNLDSDKIKHMAEYNKNINDYEIFHRHLLEQRRKLLEQQQMQQKQELSPKPNAIGDIEDKENTNVSKTKASTSNNDKGNGNNFDSIFIPRKMKRHNGAARLDDATNRHTRIKPEEQEQQQLKSQMNTEDKHTDAVAKVSSQEENFKQKYYDILKENSTTASDYRNQQHPYKQPSSESNPKDLSYFGDDNERESTREAKKQTAFEKEKSLRRNNKRYGHKTHKKKYKDYLRYSQIMMMTTTRSTPTLEEDNPTKTTKNTGKDDHEFKFNEDEVANTNLLKHKHVKKLKLEKIKTLIPSAPIFVLKARQDKKSQEDLKELEKTEEPTTKPFYEGQINYFLETPDDDSERANEVRFITKGERMDTNDWYRKLSPVLRNGNKKIAPSPEEKSGMGLGRSRGGYTPYHHYRPQHQGQLHHSQTRNHHYHQQHHHYLQQPQQQHGRAAHLHQGIKHSRHHAYQRKMIPKRLFSTTTPVPPPSRKELVNGNGIGELGHQITDIKDLDRYYAKWPHLARVQSQLHEEQMREQNSENYPDYEYDNDDYIEENDNKDDNLPPYIRKFNRRNKQLLDLLEGTIAPPTSRPAQQLRWSGSKLQPGPRDSSVGSMSVRIDDDYLKEKRKRYHQRQRQIHDLFAQQRTSSTTHSPPPYPYINASADGDEMATQQYSHTNNHLPDEDVSISLESNEQKDELSSNSAKPDNSNDAEAAAAEEDDDVSANNDSRAEPEMWQKEIETKSTNMAAGNLQMTNWQMEKLTTSAPIAGAVTTTKSALHKLPSHSFIAGGYMNRPRSRSAQFAPSSGSEYRRIPVPYTNDLDNNNHNDNMNNNNNNNNNNFINAGGFVAYNKAPVVSKTITGRFSANTPNNYNKQQQDQSVLNTTTFSPAVTETQSSSSNSNQNPSPSASTSSVTNSFIYHRVVDASPRLVGAGFIAGRKQRLPFVAITDRRLETSKKSLTDQQKDFEQNLYPLP